MFYVYQDMDVLENGNAVVSANYSYKSTSVFLNVFDVNGNKVSERMFSGYDYGASHEINRLAVYRNTVWALHSEHNTVNYGIDGDDFSNFELAQYDMPLNTLLRDTFLLPNNHRMLGDVYVDADGDIYMTSNLIVRTSIRLGTHVVTNGDPYDQNNTFFVARFASQVSTAAVTEKSRPQFSVFPNPSEGTIHFEGNNNEKLTVRIFDLLGKTIYSGQVGPQGISLSSAEKGVYLAEIKSDSGAAIEKIILR